MTYRSSRDTEYVVRRDSKPRKTTRYYYDADDDSQHNTTSRGIVRRKPSKEQRIRYVATDEDDSNYRRTRMAESNDRRVKIRHRTNGEQVVLDEDNNVLKIIRNNRSPSPPIIESQQLRSRRREPRTLYYEAADGCSAVHSPKNASFARRKNDFVYAEDEPTKVLRKVIIDPRTGKQQTIYDEGKPKKQVQQKYIIRQRPSELSVYSDNEYDEPQQQQQPQYVQIVQRQAVPKQEAPTTKYMMIRKKVDNEPVYTVSSSSIPAPQSVRRIVYESPPKKSQPTYVYAANTKYHT